MNKEAFDALLKLYDWHVRLVDKQRDPYNCGYADGIGQCILDIARATKSEDNGKFEAYKRVMDFETVERYKKKYPKRLAL